MSLMSPSRIIEEAGLRRNKRVYHGKVVKNDDPKKLGRIKVMIDELFKGLSTDDLPYISYKCPSNGAFFFAVPNIDDVIEVTFDNDFYTGYYSNRIYSEKQKSSEFDADYPNTVGYVVMKDNAIIYKQIINKTQETVHIEHKSGTILDISKEGDISLTVAKSTTINTNTDTTINTSGNLSISTTGETSNISVTSSGEISVTGTKIKLNS